MIERLPVHRIEMPTPYGIGPVNAYLIEAEPLTFIDSGIGTPEARAALEEGIAGPGFALKDIVQILVTHAHPDHFGNVHLIEERSGATIYLPKLEMDRVRDRSELFTAMGRLLVEAGVPVEQLLRMDEARKKSPRARLDDEALTPLVDGDTFPLAIQGATVELIALHMPGHSGGHMVFHEPRTGTLFAGDQLLPDVSPNPLLEPSLDEPGERRRSLKEYLHSLERMAALGVRLVYPGHGAPITDPGSVIERTIEHHHKRKALVAAHLGSDGKSPYQLATEFYPNVEGYDIFLSVSEVVAHLDLVVDDGDAVVEDRSGVTYYRAV